MSHPEDAEADKAAGSTPIDSPPNCSTAPSSVAGPNALIDKFTRILASTIVAFALLFLFNNVLTFWWQWPGVPQFLSHQQWFGFAPLRSPLEGSLLTLGWVQLLSYPVALALVALLVLRTPNRPLRLDAELLTGLSAYIVRAAFWIVLIVGLGDMLVSFLRVEGMLEGVVGEKLAQDLARPQFRGVYFHYPMMALALLVALPGRSLGFSWLALLVVMAEFLIVILRFVFSYEQAFMGDLVRFWYAALFLFASAHTLLCEGHVRVDVLYAQFTRRTKAWSNTVGLLLLGLPLCWIILTLGMWDKTSSINSPLLSFEVSQSGYGMYVKYLMVGFLVVFALSMIVQFASALLSHAADLRHEPGGAHDDDPHHHESTPIDPSHH